MSCIRIAVAFVVLLSVCAVTGYAQDAPARGWIDVNIGVAVSADDEHSFDFITPYDSFEDAIFLALYSKPPTGVSFDFGGGFFLHPALGVGLNISGTAHEDTVGFGISIPHPRFTDAYADATGLTDELTRTERVVNIQGVWAPINTGRGLLRLFAGPSYFKYSADMVENIVYDQEYSLTSRTNTVTITDHRLETAEGNAWGFHVGVDGSYFLNRWIGLGTDIRYDRGTATIREPLSEVDQDIKVGGFKWGGGLRLRF